MSLLFDVLPIERIGRWLFSSQRRRFAGGRAGLVLAFVVAFIAVEVGIFAYVAESHLDRSGGLLAFGIAVVAALIAAFMSAWTRQRTEDEVAEWERAQEARRSPAPVQTEPAPAARPQEAQVAPDIFSLPPSAFEDRNR